MCMIILSARDDQKLQRAKEAMKRDGWDDEQTDNGFIMKHKSVRTQQEARHRLHALGLLTSGSVNISIQ